MTRMGQSERASYDVVVRVLGDAYGADSMVDALAKHLAKYIDNFYAAAPYVSRRGSNREREIMLMIWNWFPGGTTAEAAAREIEAALSAA